MPLDGALGRVLAEDLVSKVDVPPFDRATYDGYAVRASDTFGAGEDSPRELTLVGQLWAGTWPKRRLRARECIEIATGAPMPNGSNAVVMVEHAIAKGKKVSVYRAVAPGENVTERGSDIRRRQRVARAGKRLTLADLGALAAVGVAGVRVFFKPKVAIISSGGELAKPGERLRPGMVYDVNGPALSVAVEACGAEPVYLGITPDRAPAIKALVRKGLKSCDLVLISGGSSAGAGDIVPKVVGGMGKPGVIVHGLAQKPGKPTFIAVVKGKPVFGLPGYPVSALMVFDQLVAGYLRELSGAPRPQRSIVRAKLAARVLSARGRRELVPVRLAKRGREVLVEPILKGSGAITSLSAADGYIEVPLERELIDEGEIVEVKLFGEEPT
ncbi:MAG: molybdopterin-binding protein [Hadesarchaea archaeon]|nr:molybdopterin-binding protein [Hadesarchaea archaeon]